MAVHHIADFVRSAIAGICSRSIHTNDGKVMIMRTKISAKRSAFAIVLALTVAGCGTADNARQGSANTRPSANQGALSSNPQTRACLTQLSAMGARFTPLPDRYLDRGCSQVGTVQLRALTGDAGQLAATNLGPVACPVAQAFAGWARFGVDRAARQILGSPLRSIETFGSYSCRNIAGSSRRSSHATAEAIDVSAFVLEDGRRITLINGWNGTAQERQFMRTIMASACRRFGTVLGPEYNAAHRDHFHLEGVIEGRSFCR